MATAPVTAATTAAAAAAAALPNGPLQVVFSFDTTGSMSGALTEVRGRLSDMLQRLQTDIPNVTTAVIAHGDYCDKDSHYLIKHVDFTDNLPQLVNFVNNVGTTHGGDEPEAYEVMLRLVRRELSWTPGSQRVLVVIGDAFPHPVDDPQNKDRIDWRQETLWLQEMGVRIYGAQVKDGAESSKFFKTMTDVTEGQHLKLSQFGTLCDVIMAICYREKGAEFLHDYEAEVRAREGRKALHKDLEGVFGVLRRADSSASTGAAAPSPPLTKPPSVKTLTKAASISSTITTKTAAMTTAKKLVSRATATARKTKDAKPKARRFPKTPTGREVISHRLLREKVPDTNFRFSQLQWSSWKLAAVPAAAEATVQETESGQWRRVLKGSARARLGPILAGGEGGPLPPTPRRAQPGSVMCEVAVQTRPGARRHVVWGRVLPAASAGRLSLSRLLASPRVRAQLHRVTCHGCRVWVRRSRVLKGGRKAEEEVKRQMQDLYDYAWQGGRHPARNGGGHREVWVPNGLPSRRVLIAGDVVAMETE